MKDSKLKYLKVIGEMYKKGKISKKEWKSERKQLRERPKS